MSGKPELEIVFVFRNKKAAEGLMVINLLLPK